MNNIASPMIALLTRKTLQVIHIAPRPHHHLEGRYHFVARRTHSRTPEQPQIVAFAQHQIRFDVQRRTHFAQPTVTAAAFQAILVPVHVQGAQQEPIVNGFAAFGARLMGQRAVVGRRQDGLGFDAVHRHCAVWFDICARVLMKS